MVSDQRIRFAAGVAAIAAPIALLMSYAMIVAHRIQLRLADNGKWSYSPANVTTDDTAVFVCMLAFCVAGAIVGFRWIRESREGPEQPPSVIPH